MRVAALRSVLSQTKALCSGFSQGFDKVNYEAIHKKALTGVAPSGVPHGSELGRPPP
jgi:hypothetical protein